MTGLSVYSMVVIQWEKCCCHGSKLNLLIQGVWCGTPGRVGGG